jgi:transposase
LDQKVDFVVENRPNNQNQMYSSKSLDHLGLVSGMFDELGIGELLDSLLPQDLSQRNSSLGTLVKALVLNGLGFSERRLYLCSAFFTDRPCQHLLGPGVEAPMLNDDALGRCLDILYSHDVTNLFSLIAAQVVKRLDLKVGSLHQDTTSFHVDGDYNSQEQGVSGLHITKGYSRDHRPDLNQVVLNLIAEGKAGIPLHMEAINGNQSDKETMRKTVGQHIQQLQNTYGFEYYVADSALYTQKSLQAMNNIKWVTRVPETLGQIKELKEQLDPTDDSVFQPFDPGNEDGYRYTVVCSTYAQVRQRYIVVHSLKAQESKCNTIEKAILKQTRQACKDYRKLCQQHFGCRQDAQQALAVFAGQYPIVELGKAKFVPHEKYQRAGRPKEGEKPQVSYTIQVPIATSLDQVNKRKKQAGIFVLATNETREEVFPVQKVLETYKTQQSSVERGFRFLKDPQFIASTMFVKKPGRLAAILFIMTICLLVYAALEFRVRQCLVLANITVPNQKGKPTQKPTARWGFPLFEGIHTLNINNKETTVINLLEHHLPLIDQLDNNYLYYYQLKWGCGKSGVQCILHLKASLKSFSKIVPFKPENQQPYGKNPCNSEMPPLVAS